MVAARVPLGQAWREGWGWGRDFRPGSPCSVPPAPPPPGARAPAGDAGARGCAGMRGATGAAQGPSGVAPRRRRSRELHGRRLPPRGSQPPPPSLELPEARARAPARAGVGSLSTPRSHRLSPAPPRAQARASAPPPPGLPPEWEGAAVPPPRPCPPGPTAAARRDAGLSARGRTTPPTDGRVSRPPGSRGWEAAAAALRGGAGAEREEGEETDRGRRRPRR